MSLEQALKDNTDAVLALTARLFNITAIPKDAAPKAAKTPKADTPAPIGPIPPSAAAAALDTDPTYDQVAKVVGDFVKSPLPYGKDAALAILATFDLPSLKPLAVTAPPGVLAAVLAAFNKALAA